MAKVNQADSVILTSWTSSDGTLSDFTTCMTDGDFGTNCERVSNLLGWRFEIDLDPTTINGFTLRYEVGDIGGMENPGDWAMLAYDSSSTVVTTAKVVVNIAAAGSFDFVAPQAFIDELADIGAGVFAVRLAPDLNGAGINRGREAEFFDIQKTMAIAFTADADFTMATEVERPIVVASQADADFVQFFTRDRPLAVSLQADANFQLSTEFELALAHVVVADADFAMAIEVDRALVADVAIDADFAMAIGRTKLIGFSFAADADFQIAGFQKRLNVASAAVIDADFTMAIEVVKELAFSFTGDADFTIGLTKTFELAFAFEADADFTLSVVRDRGLIVAVPAVADFTQALEVEKELVFAFEALVEQDALLEISDRLFRSNLVVDADFTMAIEVAKNLAFSSAADADFTMAIELTKELVAAVTIDADFAQELAVERPIDFALTVDADFTNAFDAGRCMVAPFVADADFTVAPITRLSLLATDVRVDANFQAIATHDLVLAFALVVEADFTENFVEAQRLIFAAFDATADFSLQYNRQPGIQVAPEFLANFQLNPLTLSSSNKLNFVAEANFDITTLVNDLSVAVSLLADANFLMEFETDRLPGGPADAFVIPNLQSSAFVIDFEAVFVVPNF